MQHHGGRYREARLVMLEDLHETRTDFFRHEAQFAFRHMRKVVGL